MAVLFSFVRAVAWTLVGLVVIGVLGTVVVPKVVGWNTYTVTSGSMEPTIPTGAVVAVKPVDAAELRENDVVTYRKDGTSELVTHRVRAIVGEGTDALLYMRGDANDNPDDTPVPVDAVVGTVQFAVAKVGYMLALLSTPWGAGGVALLIAIALLAQGSDRRRNSSGSSDEGRESRNRDRDLATTT